VSPKKENALVIRSLRYGDTSRIVTLFGEQTGKFAVIAKGARKGKAGAALGLVDPPSCIECLVYFKSSRTVQMLGQISLINSFQKIKSDLTLTAFASVMVQYVNRFFTEGDEEPEVYKAALKSLEELEELQNTNNERVYPLTTVDSLPYIILWLFQLNLIRLTGFQLDPFNCPVCGAETADIGRFNRLILDKGAICCQRCQSPAPQSLTLSGESVGLMRRLTRGDRPSLKNVKASAVARKEITWALDRFLVHHYPQTGKSTALEMLDILLPAAAAPTSRDGQPKFHSEDQ